jgi:hypothetical protein
MDAIDNFIGSRIAVGHIITESMRILMHGGLDW